MDNQHRHIKGYRDLTQEEIDLMNRVKEQGEVLKGLVTELQEYISQQYSVAQTALPRDLEEISRLNDAEPQRWASIARTHLQEGIMTAIRAIAQPTNTF